MEPSEPPPSSRDIRCPRQRQPLQSLPTAPLNKKTMPIIENRTKPLSAEGTRSLLNECTMPLLKPQQLLLQLSTSPQSSLCGPTKSAPLPAVVGHLTPPVTPTAPKPDKETLRDEDEPMYPKEAPFKDMALASSPKPTEPLSWDGTPPKLFTGTLSLHEAYGYGAWSSVRRATETSSTSTFSSPLTPPNSPPRNQANSQLQPTPRIYAVKTPIRPAAHDVLTHEARILTYLHASPVASTYILPFHGGLPETHSLVFDAIPLTLEAHARTALRSARENLTTRTMFDPVIGTTQWTDLAKALISGLAFLHSKHCIHGDIKPANILLSPVSGTNFQPLICDFSSSVILPPGSAPPPINPANDAITPTFTAPELLEGYRPGKSASTVTFASDVFALGVTLLVAAIGDMPYQGMALQRLTMAREGRPLEFARGGEQGSRVMKGRLVDGVLEGSLERAVGQRVVAEEWMRRVVGRGCPRGRRELD